MTLSFFVIGTPAPQGSKRHVGNGVMVESSAKVRPWRETVAYYAVKAAREQRWQPPTMVQVYASFRLARPKSHYRTGKYSTQLRPDAPFYVATKPDLDKLLRSTSDALVMAGVINDDCRIVRYDNPHKTYAPPGQSTGALLIITPVHNPREATS